MSAAEQVQAAPPASSLKMIRTLGGVALLSGFLIVLAYQVTLPRIMENKRRALERAVFQVIPGAASRATFAQGEDGFTLLEDETVPGVKAYAGYDASGVFLGVALEASAQGYQDVVRILYGYSPETQCVTGMTVLESKETPGLGDKIGKSLEFLANFECLDLRLNEDKSGLAHAVEVVKHGKKTEAWQIDGITGATISSKAVGKMINDSAQARLPFIAQHLDELKVKADGGESGTEG